MSNNTTTSTTESFKEKAKMIRTFLKDKCKAEISHSHALELASQLEGFKDWNTASAAAKTENEIKLPMKLRTMGDFRRATVSFKDSDILDGMYEFKIGELLDSLDDDEDPEDTIIQEFSLTLEHFRDDHESGIASFKLELEEQDICLTSWDQPPAEDCGYHTEKAPGDSETEH